jgi:hypothetical protein
MSKVGRKSNAGEVPLCACGCREPVTWRRGKGWNKWAHGHHVRVNNPNAGKGEHTRGDKNPMRQPEIASKVSGENHWRNRPENAERACEYISEQQSRMMDINNPNWKGGVTRTPEGRVLVRMDSKYVSEHRLLMEKHLGRPLERCEIVHHINNDPTDNRLENLELFRNQAVHVAHHNHERKCPALNQNDAPLCLCGCGRRVKESVKYPGHWSWFLNGHSRARPLDQQIGSTGNSIKKTPVPKKNN